MRRFEIVFFGLILFFCSILIDLCIRTLEAGKTFDWGPLSGWASAFVAMVAVGFASLSYRNSRRSLDLSNMSYMAKLIETFADRANEAIEKVYKNKDVYENEQLIFHFIYEIYKISKIVIERNNDLTIVYSYLSQNSVNEIETGFVLMQCYEARFKNFQKANGEITKDTINGILHMSYNRPIKEYEYVKNEFKKYNLIKENMNFIRLLKKEMNIQ